MKNSLIKNQNLFQSLLPRISTAWLVLVIALVATAWSGFIVSTLEQQQTKSNIFDFRVERIINAILHRMQAYQQVLEGGAALFAASTLVERQEWHQYVSHLHLDKVYPGIQGVGFSQVIHPQDKAVHLAAIRAEGGIFLHYTLRPEGKRDIYTSIVYLEPLDQRNQQAIGYDMFSEPIRRTAMERARDTGEAALSGKVKLVQEIDQHTQAGCLMYVPVYRNGQPHHTPAERRAALLGYVYSPFRMNDLMQGIFGKNQASDIDFHIYDGDSTHPDHLMYDETPDDYLKGNYLPKFTKLEQLNIAGHFWTIDFMTLPQFDVKTKAYMDEIVWLGGIIISILLFGVTRSLETARVLVVQQQANMLLQAEIHERIQINQALQESQKQLRLITDNIPAFIAYVDAKQTYRFVNKRYEEWFGLPQHQIIGKKVKQILGETAYKGNIKNSIEIALSGEPTSFETRLPSQGKHEYWVHGKYFPNFDSVGTVVGYFALIVDISERKRAEETIREQHAHLLAILENTEDIICLRDREGKLIFYNTAFAKIIRKLFNVEPCVGMKTLDYLSQETQAFWKPILARVLAGERYQGELTWTFEGEETHHYDISYHPIRKDKEIIGYSEYTRDITKRKQVEEKLQLHGEIVENMSEGVLLIRAHDGIIIYTNYTFDRIFGYAFGELIGKHVSTLNAPTDQSPVKIAQEIMQNLNITGIWRGELQNIRRDGSTFWCHANVSTFEHPQHGKIWIAIHQDITDRKRAEENLRESEEKYRILLENAGLGIGYYDLSGRIILFNQIAAHNVNGRPEELIGKFAHEVFSENIVQLLMERIMATVAAESPLEFEDRLEFPHGIFWFLSIFAKIQNAAGKVIGVQIISKDITERKRLEEQLQYDAKVNAALADLSKSLLVPIRHLHEISDKTLAIAQLLTQSEHGYVSFIEPSTGDNISYTLTTMIKNECTLPKEVQRIVFKRLPDGTYPRLWGHALNIRKGFYTNDPARHETAKGTPHGHLQLRSFLSVPALLEDTLVGQIALANPTNRDYTDVDLNVIEQVAVIYASALQRKRIETELSEEKQFSDDIINSLPGIFYMLDESGHFIRWNPRFAEVTGYSDAEIATKQILELIEEHDWSMISERIQEVFKHGESLAEINLLTKYGETISYHLTGRRTWVKDRAYLVGLGEDTTERKRAEEALREARDFAEQVIETANVMAIGLDLQGRIIIYNSAAEAITGYSYPEVKGQNWFELVVPRGRYPHVWEIFARLNQNEPIYTFENPILTKGGEERFISWRNSVSHKKGQVIGTFSFGMDITERKRVEEALLASERKYRMLADFTYDWEFWQGPDGHYIYVSPACERICGFKPEEFQQNPALMHEMIHPEDRVVYDQHILDHRTNRPVHSVEFRIISRDGAIHWINHLCHAVFDPEGRLLGRRGNNRDITERKQIEMEREEYFKFFQSASDLMCVADLNYHFKKVNLAFIKTLGYTQEELCSRSYLDFIHPEDLDRTMKDQKIAFSPEGTVEFENRYLSKEGKVVWLSWSAKPSPDQDVVYAIARNITERKHIEELLRANEYLLSNAVRITHLGTFEWNLLDNSNVWSEEMFHIFGIPNTVQPSYEVFLHVLHPEDRNKVTQALEFAVTSTCPYEVEYRIVLPNGELRHIQSQGEVQRNETGQARCMMGTVLDITERKRMELNLQHAKEVADMANRAKSAFLANMSHELRTPLNGILGYAQILSWEDSLTEEQKEGMGVIKQSGEYLLTLINDVLDLAKIEAGKIELFPSILFLNGFLQEVVQLFQMRAQQKNIFFSYQASPNLPTALHADEKRLRQVLINLLGNAVKFTEHGSVTLKVSYEEDTLHVQIEDTGVGMATTDLEKIFLPFHQVGDQKSKQQGTGLGLSITKNLVEMMGGHLQVSSILGQGSTFQMSLKLPEVTEALPSSRDRSSPKIIGYQGHPRTVLVIDDNDLNRSLLIKMLTPLGFIVLEAASGQTGLDKARENSSIDVIFVDLVMPDIDGFTVIQQLRHIPHHQNTILITVSASAFEYDRQHSSDVGSDDFIPKPINLEFLLARLGVHLKLTWCYEATMEETLTAMDTSLPLEVPAFELTPQQATELLHLVMCGDVMGISDYAEHLKKMDNQLIDFYYYVMKLLKQFDIEEIGELVKPFLGQE